MTCLRIASRAVLVAVAFLAPARACSTDFPHPEGKASDSPPGLEGAPADEPGVVEISISGFAYSPAVAILSPGQTLRWTNFDSIDHTATAQTGPGTLQPSGAFDTGSLLYLESGSVPAPAIGTYSYYCQPHGSSMQALIEVRGVGDVNGDRSVNFDDLLVLAANYNRSSRTFDRGDLNVDGTVNFDDLLVLASRYNTSVGGSADWALAAAVPEPVAMAVTAALSAGMVSRSRRNRPPRE